MNRIQQYLALITFYLLSTETVWPSEEHTRNDSNSPPGPFASNSELANRQSNIISPTPRRFFITPGTLGLEEQLKRQQINRQRVDTTREQHFRNRILGHMSKFEQVAIMHEELPLIASFVFCNTTICLNDGYYRKVIFLSHRNYRLSSNRFASLLLPLSSMQPFEVPIDTIHTQIVYSPICWGYAYKRDDGEFWLWVDDYMIRQ